MTINIEKQTQQHPIASDVTAMLAVTRPMIASIARTIAKEQTDAVGATPESLKLITLSRLWKESDGDLGNAFEYTVHEAILRRDPVVTERVDDALRLCKIRDGDPASILFAVEKQRSKQLIATQIDLVTDDSRVLSGKVGQPVKLKKHLNQLAAAFYRPSSALKLPQSIKGLWKADLFLGSTYEDRWVGTSIRIQPTQ